MAPVADSQAAMVSISSIERDGLGRYGSIERNVLGRYGDAIEPRGDLKAMEQLERIIAPAGLLILAIPVGRDLVVWNAHRCHP